MALIAAANRAWPAGSIGRWRILVLAGSLPRKLSPFQFLDGLIGLGTNPPPQFGHTFSRTLSTHAAQKVHSYVQMRASSESGVNALLQFSQVGLSSSMWLAPVEKSEHGVSTLLAAYSIAPYASVQKSLKIFGGSGESIIRCVKRMPIMACAGSV